MRFLERQMQGRTLSWRGRLLVVVAAVGAAAGAAWLLGGSPRAQQPALALTAKATGKLELRNSLQGRPIIRAANLGPGRSVTGSVSVSNPGARPLRLKLAARRRGDQPGPNGGRLSDALRLQVNDIRRRGSGWRRWQILYSGPFSQMPKLSLGRLGPQRKRHYEFVVAMPNGGGAPSPTGGDNAYQGSATSVDFVWLTEPRP